MKNFKKLLSITLAVLMVLSAIPVSANAATKITVGDGNYTSVDDVVIAVPETIYMTPSSGASTGGQYFVNNKLDGTGKVSTPAEYAQTNGIIGVYSPGSTAIKFNVTAVSGGIGDPVIGGSSTSVDSYESTRWEHSLINGAYGTGAAQDWFQFEALKLYINGTGLNPGKTALLQWEVTVYYGDSDTTGKTYYAYTTLYAPYLNPVGSAILLEGRYYSNNKLFASSMAWVSGVHSITNDPAANYYARTDTMVPLLTSIGTGDNEDNPDTNWISSSAGSNTLSAASFRYNQVKGSSGKLGAIGVYRSPVANITIDTSRYTNLNQIPNLTVGFNFTDKENSGEVSWYVSDYTSGDMTYMTDYSKIDSRNNVNSVAANYYDNKGVQITSGTLVNTGAEYNSAWNKDVVATTSGSTLYIFKTGAYAYRSYLTGKGAAYSVNYIQLKAANSDKSTLRSLVLKATSLNQNNYTTDSWSKFATVYQNAAAALTNPTVALDGSHVTALQNAIAGLQITATYNLDGGSHATISEGETKYYTIADKTSYALTDLGEPTKPGYTFLGWSLTENGTPAEKITLPLKATNTVYAIYSENEYYVEFDGNGGTGTMANQSFEYGETKALTKNTYTKQGYHFIGWDKNEDGVVDYTNGQSITYNLEANTTLTAVWAKNTYTLKFDGNGATEGSYADVNLSYNQNIQLPVGIFKRSGYKILGWSTDPNATSATYTNGATVKNLSLVDGDTVTLYLIWSPWTYYIKFNGNGAKGYMSDQEMTYNSPANLTANTFTMEGAEFLGWATSPNGDVVYAEGAQVNILPENNNAEITLYAVWDVAEYTVNFDGNGATTGSRAPETVKYGVEFSLPTAEEFKKLGCTLLGWSTNPDATTADADCAPGAKLKNLTDVDGTVITYYAVWREAKYKVEFVNAAGDVVATYSGYKYGEAFDVEIPANTGVTHDDYYHYTYSWPAVASTVTENVRYEEIPTATEANFETTTIPATCTQDGSVTRKCKVDGCSEITVTVLKATGHEYEAVVTPPTCTEQGYTTYTCNKETCDKGFNYTYVSTYVDALGHSPAEAVKENHTPETCGKDGYYEDVVYCSVCDEELSRTPVTVPATGDHTWGEGVVTPPTCEEPGGTKYVCTVCSHTKYEDEKPAIGHAYPEKADAKDYIWSADGSTCIVTRVCAHDASHVETAEAVITSKVALAPTCTEMGNTKYTATFAEDITWAEEQTITLTDIEELGHDWAQTTYDWNVYDGVKCTAKRICKNDVKHIEKAEAVITSAVTTPATCTAMGTTTYTATFDGVEWAEVKTKEIKNVPALGHTPAAEEVKENEILPTCTTYGSYELALYCTVCKDELSRTPVSVPKLGHTWDGEVTYTWTEDGKACAASRECSVCEATTKINAVVSATVKTPATCDVKGTTTYTADFPENFSWAVDQTKDVQDIPALGHVAGKAVIENIVEASESVPGSYEKVVYCLRCKHEISRDKVITACATNAHVKGEAVIENVVAPACGVPGSHDVVYYCTAEGCNAEISRETIETADALEHVVVTDKAKAPTCTATGLTEGSHCSLCGEVITAQTVIPATGHDYAETVTAPTCTSDGYTTYSCKNEDCGFSYETDIIPATGHSFKNYTSNNNATCTNDATKSAKCEYCDRVATIKDKGTALGHNFTQVVASTDATCQAPATITYKCSRCDATTVETVEGTGGHNWTEATCTVPKTCTLCGETEGEALGHNWADATCTAPKSCTRCDATEGEALGHDWTDATCTAPKTCKVCGATEGEALGHTWSDATCTAPKTCTVCGATEGEKAAHSFTNYVAEKAPTCVRNGTEKAKCDNCDATHERTIADSALGHDFEGRYEADGNATCKDYGTQTAKCSRCDVTDTKPGTAYAPCAEFEAKKDYTFEGNKQATCTEDGNYTLVYICKLCEKEDTDKREYKVAEAALGHDITDFLYSSEGTCVTPFSKTYGCTRCDAEDAIRVEYGDKLGNHSPKASVKENEKAPTCVKAGSYDLVIYCSYEKCPVHELKRTHVTVPATGVHTPGKAVKENEKAATCAEPGSYEEVIYCTVEGCNAEISREKVNVPKGKHTAGETEIENEKPATCAAAGSYEEVVYCADCKEEISRKTVFVAKLKHASTEVVIRNEIPATTEKGGSYEEAVVCRDCGSTLSSVKVDTPKLSSGSNSGSNSGSDSGSDSGSSSTGKLSFWEKLIAFLKSILNALGIQVS